MVAVGFVAAIVWTLGDTTSAILADGKRELDRADARPEMRTSSVEDLVVLNLFGVVPADVADSGANVEAAPVTLTLEGVFESSHRDASMAIVSVDGAPGELFAIGGELSGNVRLAEVHGDYVVTRRGARTERVCFAKPTDNASLAQSEPAEIATADDAVVDLAQAESEPVQPQNWGAVSEEEKIAQFAEKFRGNPGGTLSELGLAPANVSGETGYRVDQQTPYFRQAGLRPGDVLVSVNGLPVGDPGADEMEIATVLARGSTQVEVVRDGARTAIVTSADPTRALGREIRPDVDTQ